MYFHLIKVVQVAEVGWIDWIYCLSAAVSSFDHYPHLGIVSNQAVYVDGVNCCQV
jgi:hypothetical protein